MKRLKNCWLRCTSFPALYGAFRGAAAAKWDRTAVARFELDLDSELYRLQSELRSGAYQPGPYRHFMIRDRKPRMISAAPFRDRVVHQAVMAEVEPWLDARFIHHSYACRRNKGAHKAVDYYQQQARRYAYVLKLDIARYFPSVRQDMLFKQLERYIAEPELLAVLAKVLSSGPDTGTGIPIGNLTSQVFANLYLNDIDHFVQHSARCGAYLRYVDDLFILGDDKAQLWSLLDEVKAHFAQLGLQVHPRKCDMIPTRCKVDILGYQVTRNHRWLRNDNGYRAQRRVKKIARLYSLGEIEFGEVQQRIASWLGHTRHADCDALLLEILGNVRFQRNAGV